MEAFPEPRLRVVAERTVWLNDVETPGRVAKYARTAARKLGSALLKRVSADAILARIVEAETTSPLKVGVVQKE